MGNIIPDAYLGDLEERMSGYTPIPFDDHFGRLCSAGHTLGQKVFTRRLVSSEHTRGFDEAHPQSRGCVHFIFRGKGEWAHRESTVFLFWSAQSLRACMALESGDSN